MKTKENLDFVKDLNILDLLNKESIYIKNIFKDFDLEERDVRTCKYLNLYKEGISFCMKEEKVDFIYLYNKNIMKFSQ